jgi:hypothetical protein
MHDSPMHNPTTKPIIKAYLFYEADELSLLE